MTRKGTTVEKIIGYKSVRVDGKSWYDGSFGPWEVGATLTEKGAIKGGACGQGLHIGKTLAEAIRYGKFPFRVFRVEGVGPVLGEDDSKWRVGSVAVLKKLPLPQWAKDSESFIASIADVPWFKPTKPPRKAWRHFETRDAAGDAARGAAWGAARDAAGDAAGAAARGAAWGAARDAAGDAAWAAAGGAAWAAARGAARDAAGDAALFAHLHIVSDLKVDAKHWTHAKARWDVWTRGYGLLCDVGGVLFTYSRP